MTRLSKLMVTTGILSVVGLGIGGTSARAQAPVRVPYAPRSYIVPGTPTFQVRPGVITASRGLAGITYATSPAGSRPRATWSSATRDYSTGRDNLPLSKPWLRPLP